MLVTGRLLRLTPRVGMALGGGLWCACFTPAGMVKAETICVDCLGDQTVWTAWRENGGMVNLPPLSLRPFSAGTADRPGRGFLWPPVMMVRLITLARRAE